MCAYVWLRMSSFVCACACGVYSRLSSCARLCVHVYACMCACSRVWRPQWERPSKIVCACALVSSVCVCLCAFVCAFSLHAFPQSFSMLLLLIIVSPDRTRGRSGSCQAKVCVRALVRAFACLSELMYAFFSASFRTALSFLSVFKGFAVFANVFILLLIVIVLFIYSFIQLSALAAAVEAAKKKKLEDDQSVKKKKVKK